MTLFRDTERARMAQARNEANKARSAAAYCKVSSTGQGAFQLPDMLDFGVTFAQEPNVTYGSAFDLVPLSFALGTSQPPLPLTSGFVAVWIKDDKGLYVGAHVAVSVYFPAGLDSHSNLVQVEHHFKFEGIALHRVSAPLT